MSSNRALFFSNYQILKSKLICRQNKIRLYKTLVWPVVTYGAKSWTLKAEDMKDEEVWRVRHSNEINEVFVVEDVVRFIILKIEVDLARLRE